MSDERRVFVLQFFNILFKIKICTILVMGRADPFEGIGLPNLASPLKYQGFAVW